ncbi:MAG: hypothetical protein WBP38_02840 [Hyphomicrobium sp.]|jgi:hypothetical protein|nr:hypothetical protein [Hyphomicrobium sp.]
MKYVLASAMILGIVTASVPDVELAKQDTCVAQCRAAHNQCRMAAKSISAPNCDAQLQACIERC